MIPADLKSGTRVRCTSPSPSSCLIRGAVYTVIGYNPHCGYSNETSSVLLKEAKTSHADGDRGWMRYRFKVAANADGSDYQTPDDVDLAVGSLATWEDL